MKRKLFSFPCLVLLFLILSNAIYAQVTVNRSFARIKPGGVVNFKRLSALEALQPRPGGITIARVPNLEEEKVEEPYAPFSLPPIPGELNANRLTVASPTAIFTFEGAPDEAQGGGTSGTWNIPPDTYGAVGLDKVFTTLNNNYRILNKTTGAQLSLVSAETFWSSLGATAAGVFDPRIIYDPYNNRWIIVAVSNGSDDNNRVLLGLSQTHDPEGNYNLYTIDPDAGATMWMDFPMIGFNKNWIAISGNMFTMGGSFVEGRLFVVDYPSLLSGTASSTLFTGITAGIGGFCMHPATTFSSTESTIYMVSHLSSAGATYKLSTITGTPSVPVVTIGATKVRTGGGWSPTGGNIMPQQCVSSCPGTLVFADPGDQYNRGNVVFRNGYVWHAQTVQTTAPPIHTMVQWTKLDASTGDYVDGGRIEDVTATDVNGGKWYGHPSLSVNSNEDMMMGFAKGESDEYLGAVYALRYSTDAAGTMQDPIVYKDGEDYYEKDFGSGRNRWGDYSHTLVDPLDDASFWTIQEYAKPRAAPTVGGSDSKWGTWWAHVAPNPCFSNTASGGWNTAGTWGCAIVPDAIKHVYIMSGHNITLDTDPTAASITVNAGATLTVSSNRILTCKLIVYGTLNITGGKLTLGSNDIFLSEEAVLAGGSSSSYFITNGTGKISRIIAGGGSFEFPLSADGSSYNSLTITTNGGNPDEVFSARVSAGPTPSIPASSLCIQRTWNISEMTAGGNNATLTFKWAVGEQGGTFNNGIPPYAFRHNGTTYNLASGMTMPVLSSGIYSSSTSTAISSFSPWIVSSSSTLPVTIDYFTGIRFPDGTHRLDWKAACSANEAHFDLQRSADGGNFITLNSQDGDFIRCQQPFAYTDIHPITGKNFYRLRLRDESGKITFSKTVFLLNKKGDFEILNIQPNPVTSIAHLTISIAEKQLLHLQITDSRGSQVMKKDWNTEAGNNLLELDLHALPAGTYIVTITGVNGVQKNKRFVKQ